MRISENLVRNKGRIQSLLVICAIVGASFAIMLPLTAPVTKGVTHLASTSAEDNDPDYDTDMRDYIVEWTDVEDHFLTQAYIVEEGYQLVIPPLDDDPVPSNGQEIIVQNGMVAIWVQNNAKLTFLTDGI
ncbi:MAG: hypothetical protein JSW28_07195, partial [Thermoplasmata archaeon]